MASNLLVLKFIPLLAVVAAVGWCVWPYVDSPPIPQPTMSEVLETEARLFNLSLEPAAGRNPFVALDGPEAEPAERSQTRGEVRSLTAEQGPKATDQGGNAGANGSSPQEAAHHWNLGATLVHGRRRAAVINGRIYLLGEMVAATSPDGDPARLDRIERDLVFLRIKDRPRPVVLAYAGVASPQVPSGPAPGAAMNAAAPAKSEVGADLSRLLLDGKAASILDVIKSLGLGGLAP
ncbi:hypothetical protein SAMN05444166_2592 [Singulisphaera sp. GP187]|uniref:hypothetical protein n=1 Tax=Singulisphaera sp. GP187 TaxID=1882752 RepID=UPI00092BF261|nr:hypothetical protein [Singulisphaera sp. GP187]SIO12638.1 hypothetical protein SAMN05444166_2592 [Singulisphaera sp. GP187]